MKEKRYILKSELEKTSAQRILAGETGLLDPQARSASVTAAMVELKRKDLNDEDRKKLMDYVGKWGGQRALRNLGDENLEMFD